MAARKSDSDSPTVVSFSDDAASYSDSEYSSTTSAQTSSKPSNSWRAQAKKTLDRPHLSSIRSVRSERSDGTETIHMDEHALPWPDFQRALDIRLNLKDLQKSEGLTDDEAKERLLKHGLNILIPPKGRNELLEYLKCYTNILMVLLIVSGGISVIAYAVDTTQPINLYLGIVLFGVAIISATMDYLAGRSATKISATFKKLLPQQCKVRREGTDTVILASELTIGDLVTVNGGDRVPADIRILTCNEFKVDNSSITGESEPQTCTAEPTHENPLESHNLAYNGSLSVAGTATGIVIRVGDHSFIGMIAKLASATKAEKTTLEREVSSFVKLVGVVSAIIALGFGIATGIVFHDWRTGFLNALGLLLANVPQGLPACVTIVLALAAKRLAKRNVLVKTLQHVETLGSINVVATDKTGTLTQNRMTVRHFWYNRQIYADQLDQEFTRFDPKNSTFHDLFDVMALCNRATFDEHHEEEAKEKSKSKGPAPPKEKKIIGDASEAAFLRFCAQSSNVEELRAAHEKVYEVPFNSTNKWQLSIHKYKGEDKNGNPSSRLLLMKGAPEVILGRCSTYLKDGKEKPVDASFKADFDEAYTKLGGLGERVLGMAQLRLPKKYGPSYDTKYDVTSDNFPYEGLCFVGLTALLDPPRETVPAAVAKCQSAGIKVIMITGDHPATAVAIARQVGILRHKTRAEMAASEGVSEHAIEEDAVLCEVVVGARVPTLSQDEWDVILAKPDVIFARMSPQHKLTVVENLQRCGYCVAVTGDGVNDAPALKRADIGVAMGLTGSDVAKEAASLVLMDDDFSSIVVGIEQGRVIFDNLRKTIAYTLTHLVPEFWPFVFLIVVNLPLALSGVILLFIDLGTEIAPAISLAYEEAESDVMQRQPRDTKKDRLVSLRSLAYSYFQAGTIQTLGCLLPYFIAFNELGYKPSDLIGLGRSQFFAGAPDLVIRGVVHTADDQLREIAIVQSAWFACIVVQQWFNLIVCKTRRVSILKHGLWGNKVILISIPISIAVACFVIYVPFMNSAIGTAAVKFEYWACGLPGGAVLLIYGEVVKLLFRHFPENPVVKSLVW